MQIFYSEIKIHILLSYQKIYQNKKNRNLKVKSETNDKSTWVFSETQRKIKVLKLKPKLREFKIKIESEIKI